MSGGNLLRKRHRLLAVSTQRGGQKCPLFSPLSSSKMENGGDHRRDECYSRLRVVLCQYGTSISLYLDIFSSHFISIDFYAICYSNYCELCRKLKIIFIYNKYKIINVMDKEFLSLWEEKHCIMQIT